MAITEQNYEDYKSKYLDIYDKVRTSEDVEKVSILDDVDFELELIHRDEINVVYILQLLADLVESSGDNREQKKKAILEAISREVQLRSKKELIEKFIEENLPHLEDSSDVAGSFETFITAEKLEAFNKLIAEENLKSESLEKVIDDYLFTGKKPLREDVASTLQQKPKLLERKPIIDRLSKKIMQFVETFIEGI